jgi:hypothetical protein
MDNVRRPVMWFLGLHYGATIVQAAAFGTGGAANQVDFRKNY